MTATALQPRLCARDGCGKWFTPKRRSNARYCADGGCKMRSQRAEKAKEKAQEKAQAERGLGRLTDTASWMAHVNGGGPSPRQKKWTDLQRDVMALLGVEERRGRSGLDAYVGFLGPLQAECIRALEEPVCRSVGISSATRRRQADYAAAMRRRDARAAWLGVVA